jgi:ribosomal protein L11 methylase PrmA
MIESTSGTLFPRFKIEITKNGQSKTVEEIVKDSRYDSRKSKTFEFVLEFHMILGGQQIAFGGCGTGCNGDDCLWLPISSYEGYGGITSFDGKRVGLKLIPENKKYKSLKDAADNLKAFEDMDLDFLPKIYGLDIITAMPKMHGLDVEVVEDKEYLLVLMEEIVKDPERSLERKSFKSKYLTNKDLKWLKDNISLNTELSDIFTEVFYSAELNPEDELYKKNNFHNLKIIDFHRFRKHRDRYQFPTKKTTEQMEKMYRNSLQRYTDILDSNGLPKWKGTLYQGMRFSNGYEIKGYSSDSKYYDSYRKLPYIPLNKGEGKKVVDIGCNQGFFSFQAAMHGAKEVVGIDIQEEDIATANDIKECIDFPHKTDINFIAGDAVEYVESLSKDDNVGLVIANSVLHQIFPNFRGAAKFIEKIATISPYFVMETPANHKKMNFDLYEVWSILACHFSVIRCLYVYDAYSTGYRVIFSCHRDPVGDKQRGTTYPRIKTGAPEVYQNELQELLSSMQR